MTQPFRAPSGGRIDRTRLLRFTFDGRAYQGFQGDTLASALLANGVRLVGRSFKYHRPRGIVSAGAEEPNALVAIDRGRGRVTPNLRATQVELYEGLAATSQNRWPTLRFDAGAAAGLFAPVLSAGFYYKSFLWPASFWKRLYEPLIRRAAGLGRAPVDPDPDRYAHQYAHCDVLVIGAGPAGLAAARDAAATGARVILCDEQAEPGGSLLAEPGIAIDGTPAPDWVRQTVAALPPNVTVLPRTTAFGWFPGPMLGLAQRLTDHLPDAGTALRERLWHVRPGSVVLAAGAIERPVVFPGNDRPGVMLASAARTYLHRYGVFVGSRAVIAAADDGAYVAAVELYAAGIAIAAIADSRAPHETEAVAAARALGIRILPATTIAGTSGNPGVHTARLSTGDVIPCDTILMAGGLTPTVHLASQSREPLRFDAATGTYLPGPSPGTHAVGACAGAFDLAAILDARVAGTRAMRRAGPPLPAAPHPTAFVDFQNDVTSKDLKLAAQEGFVSVEHVKRYTTTGMATDQGKTSNLNALATIAALTGRSVPETGLTTFRPPYTPVTFGTLAGPYRGELFAPLRRPPIATADAPVEDVGTWKRARAFPRPGESIEAATARECRAVRSSVGIFDASTLGKIEVAGPDAAAFLNRIYSGDYTTLAPGRARYAVLCGEDGFVRDDGIIARLSPDRFHVTTTTGGAAYVLHHMEDYLQTEFPDLQCWLTSVTEQWAVIAVQGPGAAEMLAPYVPDVAGMPHMSVRETGFAGIPVRLFRVSFTGEAGFEINLPPPAAQQVWDTLLDRGAVPYGTDAMHVLRAQKGYIVVGQETDGTVTPDDLGLSWAIARKKGDFVGKRSLALPDLARPGRKQLVGLAADVPLEEGAQLTEPGGAVPIGHVTSAYPGIALALVADGRARAGQVLHVAMPGGPIAVRVTDPVAYDKPGDRLRPVPLAPAAPRPPLPARPQAEPETFATDRVRIEQLPPATMLSVRAAPPAATAIGMAIGVLLPTAPCRSVTSSDRAALWLGPDEWLVEAPGAAVPPDPGVTDVTWRTIALKISGPDAAWCLNGSCALDLDPSAFPVGMCARTLLGKAEIVLWRTAPDSFRLHVPRSFVPYVLACLRESATG
jgi:sarcosine oxidase subunit alpha